MLDFLGIGAQKAGSSWLYERLRWDYELAFPGGKEIHFWDCHGPAGSLSLDWYQDLFTGDEKIKGEITPAYAILDPDTIERIAQFNPQLKILYVLRNPIDRAWSSALMALRRAEMHIDEASDQWFLDHFHSAGSLCRGDYEGCLRRWRAAFPAEQILVLRFEELCQQPVETLQRCAEHLGSSGAFLSQLDHSWLTAPVFAGTGHPLRPTLRPALADLYRARIQSLADYLSVKNTDSFAGVAGTNSPGWNLDAWLPHP